MAFTYDNANVEAARNWVRLRIGDTDSNHQLFQDSELDTLISIHQDRVAAAAAAAWMLAARFVALGSRDDAITWDALAEQISSETVPASLL